MFHSFVILLIHLFSTGNSRLFPPFQTNEHWIVDSLHQPFRVQGVSKSGLEYSYLDLTTYTNSSILFDIQLMKEWEINTVRLPVRDVYWQNPAYREILHFFVDQLWQRDILSIIDLHTQGVSYGLDPFLYRKPDGVYDAMQFWKEVVEAFLDQEHVWFELFNEPFQISPDIWWEGNENYYGYRELILMIRERTSRILLIGGLDYAYQWNFLQYHSMIRDELHSFSNIVLTTHPYGYKGRPVQNGTETDPVPVRLMALEDDEIYQGNCSFGYTLPSTEDYGWEDSFGYLIREFPIIWTEFGLDREDSSIQGGWYMNALIEYLHTHPTLGWIAWSWVRERLDYPSLLQENFDPTGTARYPIKGPACAVLANQFYPGPGMMVYHFLKQSIPVPS